MSLKEIVAKGNCELSQETLYLQSHSVAICPTVLTHESEDLECVRFHGEAQK